MSSPALVPCPECRQPIEPAARVCPHCRRSVLVDVALQGAAADPRARYRAARELAALGEGVPPLSALQRCLAAGSGVVAAGVPRETGERAAAVVRASGANAVVRRAGAPAPAVASEPRGVSWLLWLLAGVAVIAFGAGAASFMRRSEPVRAGRAVREAVLSPAEVAARGLPATVALRCGKQTGSGFFVARDLVLTNAHVVCANDPRVSVRFNDGREEEGIVQATEPALDLAVVQAPGLRAAPLALGDAGSLRVGDRLTMIGSPLGLEFSVHQCGVSNLDRNDLGLALVQIDAAVNPGNSGGPLLDAQGRVVAVVTMKVKRGEGIGLAVPINYSYSGATPLVPGHPGADSPGFAVMRARADQASQEEAAKLAATGQRPGLVGALATGDAIGAHIVWPSATRPFQTAFKFALVRGEERICSLTGEAGEWQKLETRDRGSVLPPRGKAWLESHGFASDLYHSVATIRFGDCPGDKLDGPVDLVMEDADEDASRVRFGG